MRIGRIISRMATGACAAGLALALAPGDAPAQPSGEACDAWEIEYATSGNLRLSDTVMGAANGVYPVGPGRLVLRFEKRLGDTRVALVSYELREQFTIDSKTLFWTTHVTTDAATRAAPPDRCGDVAEGVLHGRTVRWTTQMKGYRTDGTLSCRGSLCGSFGAPPPGSSPLHIVPSTVPLEPFEFSPDMKTFTMASTFVSRTEQPKQTAYLALSGREVRRVCAAEGGCR